MLMTGTNGNIQIDMSAYDSGLNIYQSDQPSDQLEITDQPSDQPDQSETTSDQTNQSEEPSTEQSEPSTE